MNKPAQSKSINRVTADTGGQDAIRGCQPRDATAMPSLPPRAGESRIGVDAEIFSWMMIGDASPTGKLAGGVRPFTRAQEQLEARPAA